MSKPLCNMYDPTDPKFQAYQAPADHKMLQGGLIVMGICSVIFFLCYITSQGWGLKLGPALGVMVGFALSVTAVAKPVEPTRDCTINPSLKSETSK